MTATRPYVPHLAPPLLSWADYLAWRGFAVFPVNTMKRPTFKGWPDAATSDRVAVRELWRTHPYGNPAYSLRGLVGIDIDTPEGHDTDGKATWAELIKGVPLLPITWEVRSPTGSIHLVYRLPEGVEVTSGAEKLGPGVDVKSGPGAYLVGPGSWTMRGVYTLECQVDPAPCPLWLLKELNPPTTFRRRIPATPAVTDAYVAAAVRAEAGAVSSAPQNTRNDRLNVAAFALARFVLAGALDEQAMTDTLLDAAMASGLTERESLATIRSALRGRERAS